MELETMQVLWYAVFAASMFAYAALDGFDIGVGCLHLWARGDLERRVMLNSIGPVWDGNTLWVVIIAGSLLAGFPEAFAVLFSTLYVPMIALVFGYLVRGTALEFRSKVSNARWRQLWDVIFWAASMMLAFGFGVVLANLIRGLPLDAEGMLVGGVGALFSGYAIAMGIFTVLLFSLHGGLFLHLKTAGEMHERARRLVQALYGAFLFGWMVITVLTLIYQPHMVQLYQNAPAWLILVLVGMVGIATMPWLLAKGYSGWAFLSSCAVIASLVGNYAMGTFPNIVRVVGDGVNSLTVYNASASFITLKVLLIIALLGVPLFVLYLWYTYKVFQGKVELDTMSY